MVTTRPSPTSRRACRPSPRYVPTLEPRDLLGRALNRIKGEGRRRIVTSLFTAGVPLARIPRIFLRENLTVAEHAAVWRANGWPLGGEALPDLPKGDTEAARVMWQLPGDDRLVSLRATPFKDGACWSAIDDFGTRYDLHRGWTPWPVGDQDVIAFLHEARSETLPHQLGLFASCWEVARRRGLDREKARDAVIIRTVDRARRLRAIVDELFVTFWDSEKVITEPGNDAVEEVVQ